MLTDATVYGVIPAKDFARASKFYESTLGLKRADLPSAEGYVLYSVKEGAFLIYETQAPGGAATALGFVVADLAAEMADLRKRGVVFEEYDLPGLKTVNGVVEMGEMRKAAWFKDTEGNIISLSQMSGSP
jgi:predicted enzyme related to lactoylglutathione lyase